MSDESVQQPEVITGLGSTSQETSEKTPESEILNGSDEFIKHPSYKQGGANEESQESNSSQVIESVDGVSSAPKVNIMTNTIKPDVPIKEGASLLTEFGGGVESSANEKYREQIKQIV